MRRALKWAAIGALAFVLLVGVSLAVLLGTDFGRARIVSVSGKAVSDALSGSLSIGRLDGSLLSDFTLHDVVLLDSRGDLMARVKRIHVVYDFSMFERTIEVRTLDIDEPWARLETYADGRTNFATLVPPSEPTPSGPTPELTIGVDQIRVTNGAFSVGPIATATTVVESVGLLASGRVPLPDATLVIAALTAKVVQPALDVRLVAKAGFVDGEASVSGLSLFVDDHQVVAIPAARFETTTTQFGAAVAIEVPASLAEAVAGDPALDATLTMTATASHAGIADPWRLDVSGTLGDAPLVLAASVPADFGRVDASLTIDDLNPQTLYAKAPRASVDIRADARGPLDAFTVTATVTTGDLRRPGVLIPNARVLATIRGLPSNPEGPVRLVANDVMLAGERIGDARLNVGIGNAATNFTVDGSIVGGSIVDIPRLRAVVDIGDGVDARVSAIDLRTRDVKWSGRDMAVRVDDDGVITLDGVALTSTNMSLTARGAIDSGALLSGSRGVEVTAKDIDLALISRLVPNAPEMTGTVSANVRLDPRRLDVRANAAGLQVDEAGPFDGDVVAALRGRVLTASVSLDGRSLGRAAINLAGETPVDPLDAEGWSRRGLRGLSSLSANLTRLEIEALSALVPLGPLRAGRIDGQVRAGAEARTFAADVEGRGLRIGRLTSSVDANVRAVADAARTKADVTIDVARERVVDLKIEADVTIAALERSGLAALTGSDARLNVALARLDVMTVLDAIETATTVPRIEGVLSAETKLTKDGANVAGRVEVEVDGLRLEGTPAFDGEVRLSIEPRTINARLSMVGREGIDAAAHAVVQTPADVLDVAAWRSLDLRALKSVTASVTNTKFAAITALTGVQLPPGEVSLRLNTGPNLSAPFAYVDVRHVDVTPALGDLGAILVLQEIDGRTVANAALFASDRPVLKGAVHVTPTVRGLVVMEPEELLQLPVTGAFVSERFDLRDLFEPVAYRQRFSGALDSKIAIVGRIGSPEVKARVALLGAVLGGRAYSNFFVEAQTDEDGVKAKFSAEQDEGGSLGIDAVVAKTLDATFVAKAFAFDAILELLQVFLQTQFGTLGGRMDGRLVASGPAGAPQLEGQLSIEADRMEIGYGVPPLGRTRVDIDVDGRGARLTMKSDAGGGPVALDATARTDERSFEARLTAKDSRVAAGPVAALVTVDVTAKGRMTDERLDVEVVSNNGVVKLPGDPSGQSLHEVGGLDDVVFVDAAGQAAARRRKRALESGPRLETVVAVRTNGALRIEGETLRTAVTANVEARTTRGGVAVDGTVSLPSGVVEVIAHEYQIERANVFLDGTVPPNPRLDVVLTKDFENAIFKVIISGTMKQPELTFTADPPIYSRGELMQIFLGGEPGAEGGGDFDNAKALSAAAGLLLGPITKAARRSLPIDTIDIDVGDDGGGGSTAALTLGKWLTRDLFVAYTYTLAQATETGGSEGLLRYRFTGTWVLELKYAQSQEGSASVLWVKRF